jgi:hypothetical protein
MPRYIVMVKGGADYEAGRLPTEQELTEMGAYNEELVKAGIMLAGEGLHPSSKGARIQYQKGKGKFTVVDGPFTEAKELVAGFWILQTRSLEDTVEWLKRAPFQEGEVEIRQIFEADDFGDEFTPELREQEERLRARVAEQAAKNE